MSLERLLEAIEREARAKAEAVREAARREAARIAEEAARRLERRRAAAESRSEAVLRAEVEMGVAAARSAARARALAARRGFLERVRAGAEARLAGGDPAELEEALACAGEGPVEVRCDPLLAGPLRTALRGRAGAAVIPDPEIRGGFVVIARGGALRVDARLTTALARAWPALAIELTRRIEGGGGS